MYNDKYYLGDGGSLYHHYEDSPKFEKWAEEIDAFIKSSNRYVRYILEIGCAHGYLVRALLKKKYWAVGVDASQWAIDNATEDVKPYVKQATATFPTPYAADDHFNMVVSFDTLEHLTEEEVDVAIPEFFRICNAGIQYHVITTPEYTLGHDHTHVTMKPIEWWRKKFEDVRDSDPKYKDTVLHITYERSA